MYLLQCVPALQVIIGRRMKQCCVQMILLS